MKAFFWIADHTGCGYYRGVLPTIALRKQGHEADFGRRIGDSIDTADVIVGQRVCMPAPTSLWQLMARRAHKRLVFELDDDLFAVPAANRASHRFFKQPEIQENLKRNIQVADHVIVSTEQLADVVSEWNTSVSIVENAIPDALLTTERQRHELFTVGWGGSSTHALDVGYAGPAIRRFFHHNRDVRLHVMGADYRAALSPRPESTSHTPWSGNLADYFRAIDYDVALAPMRHCRFNLSKSALRPLEMAALGIPVVCSPVGEYRRFVRHGVTGLWAKDGNWRMPLEALLYDGDMARTLGRQAREVAREHTVTARAPEWEVAVFGAELDSERDGGTVVATVAG